MSEKELPKEVYFREENNTYHVLPHCEGNDDAVRWFSKEELLQFNLSACLSTYTITSKQYPVISLDLSTISFTNVFNRIYVASRNQGLPRTEDFQRYLSLNKLYTEIRGMERYCARNLIERINQNKLIIKKNLFRLQAKLRSFNLVPDIKNKILRDAYAKDAQPDRILARIQGIVDAVSSKRMREEKSSVRENFRDTRESATATSSYKLGFARKKTKRVHLNI